MFSLKNIRSKLICIKCSYDEKTNPACADVEFVPIETEFFDSLVEELETWQCPNCGYRLWMKTNYRDQRITVSN